MKTDSFGVLSIVKPEIIVDPVIICTRFEETGNELPYYERVSGKEQVYK